jgi:caffeoyl-CoA O-methyltransferase
MGADMIQATPPLQAYMREVSLREPEVLQRLRAETEPMEWGGMQICPEQGQFLALLVEAIGARRCLEVGVFTGYSSLAVALALPPDGKIVACDVSADWTAVARRYWAEAGVAHKIDLRLAPAIETLDRLLASGQAGSFDFAFIDADKPNYDGYYERALKLIHAGGLIAIDNVLWGGSVIKPEKDKDENTLAIRALNRKLRDDKRISLSMMPIGDGVTLAWKRH